ncbi:MAG TPA: hypothetical protein VFW55_08130 [Propionicimonas sp.]|nr:hypothetical protein [Propionicimonas sp.]
MGFRYQPPSGWPRSAPPPGFVPGAGWAWLRRGGNSWWEERPHLVAAGIGLDVAVFLSVWLVTLGFARLDLTMYGARTTAAWFWLWIAGAGMGLTGAIVAASPGKRSIGLGILLGLPLPVLLGYFLTA